MSIDGQEILTLHDLGYRFTDRIDELSCLQVQVLIEALRHRNEKIRESLEVHGESCRDAKPLDELVHVLPRAPTAKGSPIKDESAGEKERKWGGVKA
ncbi:MAG: hypothetical protein QXT26_05215 [Thermoproteota archaeon]